MDSSPHNFVVHTPPRPHGIFKRTLAIIGITLLIVFGATAALAVPAFAAMRTIYADALSGRDALERAKTAAEVLDFAAASSALSAASEKFQAGENGVDRLGLVAHLPFVSRDIANVRGLLDGGKNASDALRDAVDVGADLAAIVKQGAGSFDASLSQNQQPVGQLTDDQRRALFQQMQQAPDKLEAARASLDKAIASFDGVRSTPLTADVITAIKPQVDKLRELRGLLSQDLSVLREIPKILGYPDPKTYLFLLLNNTELRPGGGFIGTYGTVKIADGALTSFFTDDVYHLDGPSEAWMHELPPAPISKFLKVPSWYMRDGNWSPDFVHASLDVENLYRLEKGPEPHFDGLIGMTPTVISKLLKITGPIQVGGSTFNADNITDELEYQVEKGFVQNGTPMAQRKDVVGALGQELVKHLMTLPAARLPELAAVAQEAVEEKQLMATFDDPELAAYADVHGWSGRLPAATGDALMIADANLASLKSDPVVNRTISYAIKPDGAGYDATASITYTHTGHFDWKTTRYRTYTRFYVPPGATLIKGDGMMQGDKIDDPGRHPGTVDVGTDLGHTVFGAFISIEPGETRTLSMTYRLPDDLVRRIKAGGYRLDVSKELGTPAYGLTVDLDFGKKLSNAMPPEASSEWGDDHYRLNTDLRVDRTFTVDLAK